MIMGRAATALLLAALVPPSYGATDVFINLTGRSQAPALALGMPPFLAQDVGRGPDALIARQLQEIVRDDLLFSRYFQVIEQGPLFTGANLAAILPEWKLLKAGWVLTARAADLGSKISLTVQLTDLGSGESLFERHYRQDRAFLRSLAHKASDDVVLALTGRNGIAHTQIAFVNNQSGNKEVFIMDYDGAGARQLTNDRSISLLPRLSPDRKRLAYTTYKRGNPDLYLLDLEAGRGQSLSAEQGLNIAGGFSPDGAQILMTLSRQASPNLYLKTLADGGVSRLTQHFGVDTSPTFSPDAAQVAFVSDRSGNPQIYLLNLTTQRAKRLTRLNWCDSPAWSPTGEWIAFAGRAGVRDPIDIYIIDVTGTQIRQLTRGEGANENPTWSPDGRFIAFISTRNKKPELFMMDADGSAPHRLADLPGSSFTPNWSN